MSSNDAIDYINRDIVNVKNELQVLSKLVRDGNGQPSLIQQVNTISNRLDNVEMNLTKGISELKTSIEAHQKTIAEKSAVSWQLKVAILVACISSATSIYINWQDRTDHTLDNKASIQSLEKKLDTLIKGQKVTSIQFPDTDSINVSEVKK